MLLKGVSRPYGCLSALAEEINPGRFQGTLLNNFTRRWAFCPPHPPAWPILLPISQRMAEEDCAWRDLQAQWGLHGLALSHSLVQLKAVVNITFTHAEDNLLPALDSLQRLKVDTNEQVATPLAHTLWMAGGSFNNLSTKCCKRLAKGVKDAQLSRCLEETAESLTHLFPEDISGAMEAARARCIDCVVSMVSRTVSAAQAPTRHATASSQASFRGRQTEPYSAGQPFCGGRSRNFSSQGCQNSSCGILSRAYV